ncbi:MAG: hypothetical protein OEM51_02005 [Gammaproteobacteria bacterium]|nr:hypothetical protein [Gammaproteobacteria bacterium]
MAVLSAIPSRIAIAGLLSVWLCGCGGPAEGPEEAIRSWVKQGRELAEAKDRRALVGMISPNYTDARGNNRDDIEDKFRIYFLRQNKVALITRIEELNIHADSAADLVLSVAMAGTNDGTLGFSADAYRFEMEFELEGGKWLLTSARWGDIGGDLL